MFSRYLSRAGPFIAVALAVVGGLIFDAMTPKIISVTLFYVSAVLAGYWFPQPRAALALILLAAPLIIVGHWIGGPNKVPDWEAWFNRGLSIGTVSLAAVFVWYIRVLEQKLKASKDLLQFALDAARLGWWQYDPRRRVASGDRRFEQIFDVTSRELPSVDIKNLVHPDDAERYWADREAALDPVDPKSSAHEYEFGLETASSAG
jgi:PAS domain-containing protein